MTIEQAKSELMQIYGALSPDKQRAIDTVLHIIEQEPSNVMEHDKDHIWYKGGQYISLRRFLEVKAEAEQEPIEVEATKLQMAYNQGFEDCRKAVMDLLSEAGKLSLLAMVADLPSVNPQEPKTGHWIYDKTIENWRCSKCNETPKTMGYVGTADFMAEHFKFCNHCGCRMVEPQESEG